MGEQLWTICELLVGVLQVLGVGSEAVETASTSCLGQYFFVIMVDDAILRTRPLHRRASTVNRKYRTRLIGPLDMRRRRCRNIKHRRLVNPLLLIALRAVP